MVKRGILNIASEANCCIVHQSAKSAELSGRFANYANPVVLFGDVVT